MSKTEKVDRKETCEKKPKNNQTILYKSFRTKIKQQKNQI